MRYVDCKPESGPCAKCGRPGFYRVVLGVSVMLCKVCAWGYRS